MELLNRDDVGFESLKDADARAFVTLLSAGGGVGGHDAEVKVALRQSRSDDRKGGEEEATNDELGGRYDFEFHEFSISPVSTLSGWGAPA